MGLDTVLRPRLRETWAAGGTATGAWVTGGSPLTTEVFGTLDFDVVVVDLQHGTLGHEQLLAHLTALAASPASAIVRVPGHGDEDVMRALDAGAHGVMCPAVDTAEQAAAFVAACRYPPAGRRGWGPYRAALRVGGAAYAAQADDALLAVIQIESVTGLEHLDEIVAVPGVDAVFVGPVDLSLSDGGPATIDYDDPTVAERHRRIVDRAHAHGVRVGMIVTALDQLPAVAALGADWISIPPDVQLLAAASAGARDRVRALSGVTA